MWFGTEGPSYKGEQRKYVHQPDVCRSISDSGGCVPSGRSSSVGKQQLWPALVQGLVSGHACVWVVGLDMVWLKESGTLKKKTSRTIYDVCGNGWTLGVPIELGLPFALVF